MVVTGRSTREDGYPPKERQRRDFPPSLAAEKAQDVIESSEQCSRRSDFARLKRCEKCLMCLITLIKTRIKVEITLNDLGKYRREDDGQTVIFKQMDD